MSKKLYLFLIYISSFTTNTYSGAYLINNNTDYALDLFLHFKEASPVVIKMQKQEKNKKINTKDLERITVFTSPTLFTAQLDFAGCQSPIKIHKINKFFKKNEFLTISIDQEDQGRRLSKHGRTYIVPRTLIITMSYKKAKCQAKSRTENLIEPIPIEEQSLDRD